MVPHFVNEMVGWIPGMSGIFISCVFSASMSTVSAVLNSIAGVVYNDFVRKIRGYNHTEIRAQMIMKTIIVIVGIHSVLCGFMVEKSKSVFELAFYGTSVTFGVICGIFTMGMFNTRANSKVYIWF